MPERSPSQFIPSYSIIFSRNRLNPLAHRTRFGRLHRDPCCPLQAMPLTPPGTQVSNIQATSLTPPGTQVSNMPLTPLGTQVSNNKFVHDVGAKHVLRCFKNHDFSLALVFGCLEERAGRVTVSV